MILPLDDLRIEFKVVTPSWLHRTAPSLPFKARLAIILQNVYGKGVASPKVIE